MTALVHEVAAQVHVPFFGQGVEGEQKSPGEVVSRVDREAERLLVDGLADLTPGVSVVGEEAAAADPSLVRALRGERAVWLVDPLDGTQQFLAGSPDHAIMLALVQAGQTLSAVVHQPQHERTYTAELGSGTWRAGHGYRDRHRTRRTCQRCGAASCAGSWTKRPETPSRRMPAGSVT